MTASTAPVVIIIAGPNGAGKTTASKEILRKELSVREFVNADWIARGLSGFSPETAAIAAGRVMLERLRLLAREKSSFAFETTLASRTFVRWIRQLREQGYRSQLIYLWVPDPALCLERVRTRVSLGGHDVPEETIRRRFESSLQNLFQLYLPLVDVWEVYDSSKIGQRKLIAQGARDGCEQVMLPQYWQRLKANYGKPDGQ